MRPRWTLPATIAGALVLGVAVAFAPMLQNGFVVWDDDLNLTANLAYRGLSPAHLRWMATTRLGGHWQPLTWLSFAIDHAVWGMNPAGYHLTSLLLHAANAVVFYGLAVLLLRRACGAAPRTALHLAAGFAAGSFALHPLRVESVAWASERRDVLSGLFWLLALVAYVRMADGAGRTQRRWLGASIACLALSLCAKAWGMTFPLVLLILDAYPLRRLGPATRTAILREKLPFAALALAGAVLAFDAQHSVEEMRTLAEHGPAARVAQAAYALWFYLGKTLVPWPLWPAYLLEPDLDPAAPRYLVSLVALAAATIALLRLRKRWPWALAAATAYAVILAPVLGLAQTGPQIAADRYTYLACLPWSLLAGAAVWQGWSSTRRPARSVTSIIALIVLATLGTLTWHQTRIWVDSRTLWDHVLHHDPRNWVAWTNRGWVQPDPAAAIADYTAAIDANPSFYPAWYDRGEARHKLGDYAGAATDFTRAIELAPRDPKAWNNRGWAREALGDRAGAADRLRAGARRGPARLAAPRARRGQSGPGARAARTRALK